MRPFLSKTSIAVLLCLPFSWQISHAGEWTGSYSAQGQCYCIGELPLNLSGKIVPTPVGGQTISQVCKRLGDGPELLRASGLFNFPVYKDPQCGNGPFASGEAPEDPGCVGSLDGVGNGCQAVGPKWNLDQAFGKVSAPAAAQPLVNSDSSAEGLISKPVVSTAVVEGRTGQDGEGQNLKATIIKSPSTAGSSFDPAKSTPGNSNARAIEAFTGKSVTLDGQRYLQAHSEVSASGGEPGSRIILDGLIYLREDVNLDPADLYQDGQKTVSTVAPALKAAPKVAKPSADELATTRRIEIERAAIAAKVKAEAQLTQQAKVAATQKAELDRQVEFKAEAEQAQKDKQALLKAEAEQAQKDKQALLKAEAEQAQKDKQALLKADAEQTQREKQALLKAEAEQTQREKQALLKAEAEQAQKDKQALLKADVEQTQREKQALLKAEAEQAQKIKDEQRMSAYIQRQQSVDEATAQVNPTVGVSDAKSSESGSTLLTALRLPPEIRRSAGDFSYLEAMPVNYDVGGNGVLLEGSGSSHTRFQYVGRLGITAGYQEVMIGGGYYITPAVADRLTVALVAGFEYGSFELSDDQLSVDFDDSGVYLGASTRIVLSKRFELKGGVGYSTFFEGDPMVFGGGYYHVNRKLDVVSRFELGDNDLLGIGVRFYY